MECLSFIGVVKVRPVGGGRICVVLELYSTAMSVAVMISLIWLHYNFRPEIDDKICFLICVTP